MKFHDDPIAASALSSWSAISNLEEEGAAAKDLHLWHEIVAIAISLRATDAHGKDDDDDHHRRIA